MTDFVKLPSAVRRFVNHGSLVAVGGQNTLRNPVAAALEIIKQRISGLCLVGCNLSISADLLVGAGLVRSLVCGTINLETYGVPSCIKDAIEKGTIEIIDHDHLTIICRLLATQLGIPFIPVPPIGRTDIISTLASEHQDIVQIMQDPWIDGQEVPLAKPLAPDVCVLHVACADEHGNLYVNGSLGCDPDLAMASSNVVVTCEEVLDSSTARREYGRAIVPGIFVSTVSKIVGGAKPSGVPDHYDTDGRLVALYQQFLRDPAKGSDAARDIIAANINKKL